MTTKLPTLLLALLLTLTACQPAATPLPTALPTALPSPTAPPATPTAAASTPLLHTSLGDFEILSARFVDEVHGVTPSAGQKILLLVLAQPGQATIALDAFSLEAFREMTQDTSQGGLYILGSDGSYNISTMAGWVDEEFAMGFPMPTTAETYTLYWPGNPPIELTPEAQD